MTWEEEEQQLSSFFFFFFFLCIEVCLWLVASVNTNRVSNCRDINRVSKTQFPSGRQVEKCQIRPNQNMKTKSLKLDL